MSTKPDGGPAFPQLIGWETAGMSLRDHFAGNAPMPHDAWIQSEIARTGRSYGAVCASFAYEFADAMLAERER